MMFNMNPIPARYLTHVLNAFPNPPIITEKLRQSLILGLEVARQEDIYAFDDSLMLGLIAARSVVIPVLDSADVDITAYARRLRDHISGHDRNTESPFRDEYNALKRKNKNDPGAATQAYRNLQIAQALARARELPAIDTACFLKAIFSNGFNSDRQIDDATSQYLATTPVIDEIENVLHGRVRCSGRTKLSTIADHLNDEFIFLGNVFEQLSPFVRNLSSFERIENAIRFAKNVEPFIESSRLLLLPGSRGLHFREFDYANTYACRDEHELAGCKINTCSGAGLISWRDVEAFEFLINRDNVSEWDIQQFLERRPGFLLGNQRN